MQGGKQPTAAQKRWQEWQREQGCHYCKQHTSIHHCVGSTAKHNKVWIGQWWTLPLCYDHHQDPVTGIHAHPNRKVIEKQLFMYYWNEWMNQGNDFPQEVYEAIMDYHR